MILLPLRYSLRSLARRPVSVTMTALGIALVVALFVAMGALAEGLAATFTESGSERNVVVTRRGALAESMSSVPRDALASLRDLDGVAQQGGNSLASPEAVILWVTPLSAGGEISLAMRGVTAASYLARPRVRVIEGRRPMAGSDEAMIGKALVGRVEGLLIGGSFRFGRRTWRVVGVFDGAGPLSSEIWTDLAGALDDDGREAFSSVLLPLATGASAEALIGRIESDRRFALHAQLESAYYRSQAGSAEPLRVVTGIVAFLMGLGAIFGALNTMMASLAGRTREVAALRALGFPQASIAATFVTEALCLALPAGALGCLMALPITSQSMSMANLWTFSTVAFQPRVTAAVLASAMVFAFLIGVLGGLWPATRAARVPLSVQLRA